MQPSRIRSGTIGASVTVAFCCARADCDPMVSISAAPPPTVGIRRSSTLPSFHKQEVEEFVVALSGKKLSVREIEQLAHGYFRGPASFRQAIREGHPGLVLETMRQVPEDPDGCNEFERVLLKDLEITQKYMLRVMGKSEDRRLKTPAFHAQVNLLTAGILSQQQAFFDSVRKLHDRSGQAQSGVSTPPGGHEHTRSEERRVGKECRSRWST